MTIKNKYTIIALLIFVSFFTNSCNSGVTEPKSGTVSVLVVDNDPNSTPVPNIPITLSPLNLIQITGSNGITNFEVETGDYFVDAEVCCQGPLNIVYHVPVKVTENKTSNVKLTACLSCE